MLWRSILNPLGILLAVLATIFFAADDVRAGTMMVLMIALSVGLKLCQELKAGYAAAKLKAMISVTATVVRDGTPVKIAVSQLVPVDVVQFAAVDMVPGDIRIVSAKDLFVIQGSLTARVTWLRSSISRNPPRRGQMPRPRLRSPASRSWGPAS